MGGGVMSKVGMCCDCSRRYTEQGSKSCRKQDLLKKRLVCEFLLILFVYFRVSRENRKVTLVNPQKPYLSWLVISEKTARALFCLFLPPFFFFGIPNLRHWNNWHFFRFHEKAILPCDEHIYPYLQVLLKALTIWRKKWFNRPWKILFTNP